MILVISIPYPDSVHSVYSECVHKLSEGCNLCLRNSELCVTVALSTGMHIIHWICRHFSEFLLRVQLTVRMVPKIVMD